MSSLPVNDDAPGSSALSRWATTLTGGAVDRVGPSPVFIVGGAIGAAVIALGLPHPAVRSVD